MGEKVIKKRKSNKIINWLIVVITAVFDVSLVLLSFGIESYSGFSKGLFIGIYAGIIGLMLILNTLVIISILKKQQTVRIICLVLCVLMTVASCFGYYTITRINSSIGNIVNEGDVVQESLSVAFVTYNDNLILQESDIEGCKFGVVGNESFKEGNTLAKEELEAKNIKVEFVEFDNYNELLLGLFNEECDVAALPANYYDMFSQEEGYEDYLELTNIVYSFDKVVDVSNNAGNKIDVTSHPFTVLIIGVDEGRSDSLILMSVNPITMTLTMTSIARDTYVPISCYTGKTRDKINHARSVSRQCTIDTVSEWLDVDIDFYIETNFQAVVDIVNALGGLVITSPVSFVAQDSSTERGHYTVYVPEGTNPLNGEQVLAFARERHNMPKGDYDRQLNQQQVIKAMLEQALKLRDVNKLLELLEVAGSNISTNMSANQMTTLANYIFKVADATPIDYSDLIKIKNSRITGYSSYYYNYSSRLPLWIMLPYNGAVKDAQKLINDNLRLPEDKTPSSKKPFVADVTWYEKPEYFSEFYNEPLEKIDMPDFMPVMKNKYTLEQARAWCRERNIKLTVINVKEGDSLYIKGAANGTIVGQSVAYATLTSDFSELTLWVIGGSNIPDFAGSNYKEAVNWANNNGFYYEFVWVLENDASYDEDKAGQIISQKNDDDKQYVVLTAYDYPAVSESFPGNNASKTSVEQWAERNEVAVEFVGTGDKVVSYSVKNYTGDTLSKTIKKNSLIIVNTEAVEYTVTFKDPNGNVLSEQKVKAGESAVAPTVTAPEGKEFDRWDNSFTNVSSDITVTAIFKDKEVAPPEQPEGEEHGNPQGGEGE